MPFKNLTHELSENRWTLEDGSGYSFTITTKFDPERGWSASITLRAGSYLTESNAQQHLRDAVAKFLEMAEV